MPVCFMQWCIESVSGSGSTVTSRDQCWLAVSLTFRFRVLIVVAVDDVIDTV